MRPIKDYPGYFVTDTGVVYSNKRGKGLRPLVGCLQLGYRKVSLSKQGKDKLVSVHVLVLEAFVGKRPKGYQACHNDGNPANNRLENLRWDTAKGNQQDRIKHGTTNRGILVNEGEKNYKAKLTSSQVLEIDSKLKAGAKQIDLAKEYGVDFRTIHYIQKRKRWRWLLDKS